MRQEASDSPRLVTLLALTMGVFLVTVNVTVVTVALPDLQRDLGARPEDLQWVVDAYNLMGASLLLLAGFLADRFGRKRALCTGYILFTLGAVLCTVAPSVGWLIGFRVLQAAGGTALTPTSLAIVANIYPDPLERAKAIGVWGVSSGIGTGMGPIIGGAMSDWLGWRGVFGANAVAGAIALVIAVRVVPRSRSARVRRLDLPGQALVAALLGSLTYALIEGPRYGWGSGRIAGILVADVVLAGAFALVELRAREPLVDLHFFRDRQFSGAVFITVASFFSFAGFVFFNALYLQQVRGYSALEAGALTLPAALPTLAGGPLAGWLVARRGARGVLAAGTALMAAGLLALALVDAGAPLGELLSAYLLLGIGYAVINAPISTVAVATMPRDQAGVAAALVSSARNVGLVLGIAVLGSIVNHQLEAHAGPEGFPAAFTDAVHASYVVAAGVSLAAALAAVATLRAVPPGQGPAGASELPAA